MIKVVYADDNIAIRRTYRSIFEEENDIEVVGEASDGLELLNLIEKKKPDVVIIDIVMPKVDGLDVIKKVFSDSQIKKKPAFIAVSAIGDDNVTKEAFDVGVRYFILKPVNREILIDRIHWALELKLKKDFSKKEQKTEKIELEVAELLYEMGMPVHIIGHKYIRDAVEMVIEDETCIEAITKLLYPDVAKKNNTNAARVERAMRHAIEVVWEKGNVDLIKTIFKIKSENIGSRPTNSEFISRMAEYIKRTKGNMDEQI